MWRAVWTAGWWRAPDQPLGGWVPRTAWPGGIGDGSGSAWRLERTAWPNGSGWVMNGGSGRTIKRDEDGMDMCLFLSEEKGDG